MYAVVESGGKQYKVRTGEVVALEKLEGEKGTVINLERVLMIEDQGEIKVGTPIISGAVVRGEILRTEKAKKIIIFKKKRRKAYRRTNGHRQLFTQVKITGIEAESKSA